jgi:hypothetical protein
MDGAKRWKTSTRRIGCPFELYGLDCNGNRQLKVRTPLYSHGPSDLAAHPQARKFAEYISTQNHNVILIKDSQILEPRLPAPIHKRISNRCGTWLLEYLNSPAPQIAGFFVYCMN